MAKNKLTSLLRQLRSIALFALLWWVLTEGEADSLAVGVPFVLIAALVSTQFGTRFGTRLRTGVHAGSSTRSRIGISQTGIGTSDSVPAWSPLGLAQLLPFFLWHSLRGGIDVARRALAPRLRLRPIQVSYRLRLPAGPATILMANLTSLLPGTLSVAVDDYALWVHVLDSSSDVQRDLAALERRVAALFGLRLEPGPVVGG